ncbi:hypothetical protein [Oceanobacillus sp. J11TS1]|uniref:hypothetical protein n=1 Tax=Oceanobacillus sp. J11TS1 TaxID=2807191 RepID=UPI001B1160E2|nr:hypothetical protein [Oceanobacillus sp. J11TS1]GIO21992.1 swarming motility protein SwrB [Oceanobacillus sp. J11TS1]
MSTLLWMISFLLHGISILAIYLLLKSKQNAGVNEQTQSVLKDTLEEIREENRRLQNLLQEDSQPDKTAFKHEKTSSEEMKPEPLNRKQGDTVPLVIKDQEISGLDAYQTIALKDEVETSLEAKILQLHAKGETVDNIANKLNCGKTEAEIIIKLHLEKRKSGRSIEN